MLNSMAKQIAKLEDHYILCGAGRTGSHIIERFSETDIPFVVIEQSLEVLKEAQECVKGQVKRLSRVGRKNARRRSGAGFA